MEAAFRIEVSLNDPSQLFEPPGPFGGRSVLHHQLFERIVAQAGLAPRGRPLQIVLRSESAVVAREQDIREAFHNSVTSRDEADRQEIRQVLRDGRQALLIGMTFLVVATAIGEVLHEAFQGRLMTGVANGLEIFGWVALWRPAELLLYEWMPIYRRLRLLNRLADATIEIDPE